MYINRFVNLIRILWQKKLFIIYFCFLGAVAAVAVNKFAFDTKYTYSLSYYVTNSELSKISIDVKSLDSDVLMANSCKILIESELTMNTLSDMLVEKYGAEYLKNYFTLSEEEDGYVIDYDQLSSCVEVTNVSSGTAVLNIKTTSTNPYLSQDMGRFMAYLAPNVIFHLVGADYISPFETAQLTAERGPVGDKKALLAGIGLGFIISIIIVFFYNLYCKKIIINKEDVKIYPGHMP
ncbi:MAG: hypothetical protein LUH47_01310 [Clostridiales bacterium]|nr:hypothetical protein [Clostridiales bacterium]